MSKKGSVKTEPLLFSVANNVSKSLQNSKLIAHNSQLTALVVVLHADDVVFTSVFTHLDFHDYERKLAFVL